MRENAARKAERLLVSGRVVVVHANGREIRALVRGDTEGFHVVEHTDGRWTCDCTARALRSRVFSPDRRPDRDGACPACGRHPRRGRSNVVTQGRWISLAEVFREQEAEAADYLAGREERLAAKTRDEPGDDRRQAEQAEQAEPEPKPEDDP